jgi:glutaredoxin
MKIYAKSHLRTVPQIFVDEVCLWGYDAISELHERGELLAKL